MGTAALCFDQISSYSVAKTLGSGAWRSRWILSCFRMFSQLHSGVTGIFDLLLFVSTLIFISMKDAGCQLSVNINFVFGSSVSKLSSRGLICIKCFSSPYFRHLEKYCLSSVDKLMAVFQLPPPTLHCTRFILLTQDKSQTNVIQLSGSLSLGAFIHLSGSSGLLNCQLTLTDS